MSTDHGKLTQRDLVAFTARSMELAAGLADNLTVTGISLGGVLAVWAAQYRAVAVAAPIAPAFGVPVLPYSLTTTVFRLAGRLPNRFVWWDPRYRERLPGPDYAYRRFSTHAFVAMQELGRQLLDAAASTPSLVKRIWVISNAADFAVSNSAAATLVHRWQSHGAAAHSGAGHDGHRIDRLFRDDARHRPSVSLDARDYYPDQRGARPVVESCRGSAIIGYPARFCSNAFSYSPRIVSPPFARHSLTRSSNPLTADRPNRMSDSLSVNVVFKLMPLDESVGE